MRQMWAFLAVFAVVTAAGADAPSAVGSWLADDGKSHVAIAPCGPALCGTVSWLQAPLDADGQPLVDAHNPDPSLQSRPIIGLQVLSGFVPDSSGPGQWEDGSIYDPEEGRTYRCTMTLQDANTLRVHGYVGVALFGTTQLWTRLP